jgi:hypothetical protein
MRRMMTALALLPLLSSATRAQEAITCSGFERHEDGSWSPLKTITIRGPNREARFEPGMRLRAGEVTQGVDLGGLLDVMCGTR